jgi:hypothetical protein
MPRTANEESGWFNDLFGDLVEPPRGSPTGSPASGTKDSPTSGIGDLARALGVPVRRIRRWIGNAEFPESPYWVDGTNKFAHRRRYTIAMIEAAQNIAEEVGLTGKRRWDLGESDFGEHVSEAW